MTEEQKQMWRREVNYAHTKINEPLSTRWKLVIIVDALIHEQAAEIEKLKADNLKLTGERDLLAVNLADLKSGQTSLCMALQYSRQRFAAVRKFIQHELGWQDFAEEFWDDKNASHNFNMLQKWLIENPEQKYDPTGMVAAHDAALLAPKDAEIERFKTLIMGYAELCEVSAPRLGNAIREEAEKIRKERG